MRKFWTVLAMMTLLISPWLSAQGAWTVTPGEGVGAITLGMTSTAAETLLLPTEKIGTPSSPQFVRYGDELLLEYQGNKVIMISLHKNSFKTKNGTVSWSPYKGASIGADWNAVVNQLPANKMSRKLETAKGHPVEFYHAYTGIGLGFRVKGGSIVQVDVWDSK